MSYDNHKFTGKEEDGSGLYYFGARYYDKSIGRWISPDPASYPSVLRLNDPQSFNPYVYCWNNPLKNIDRNGEMPVAAVVAIGAGLNAGAGAGISIAVDLLVTSALKGKNPSELIKSGEYTGKDARVAGLVGAAGGILFSGIGSMTAPVIVKMVTGGITGGGLTALTTLAKEGRLPTVPETAIGVGTGTLAAGGAEFGTFISKTKPGALGTGAGGIVSGITSSDIGQGVARLVTEAEMEANPIPESNNISIDFDFQKAEADVVKDMEP